MAKGLNCTRHSNNLPCVHYETCYAIFCQFQTIWRQVLILRNHNRLSLELVMNVRSPKVFYFYFPQHRRKNLWGSIIHRIHCKLSLMGMPEVKRAFKVLVTFNFHGLVVQNFETGADNVCLQKSRISRGHDRHKGSTINDMGGRKNRKRIYFFHGKAFRKLFLPGEGPPNFFKY